jgi:hypothetical protein
VDNNKISKQINMEEFEETMKECCGLCPFSRDKTLFLHPDRAEDFATSAENPYNDFVCHKTGHVLEDNDRDIRGGDIVRGEKSLTCMGFASMQENINGTLGDVRIDPTAFEDSWEVSEHHTDAYERKKNR